MLEIEIATCNTKFTKVVSVLFKKTNSSTRPMRILFSCQVSRFEFETSNSQTDRHSKYKKKTKLYTGLGENSLDFRV